MTHETTERYEIPTHSDRPSPCVVVSRTNWRGSTEQAVAPIGYPRVSIAAGAGALVMTLEAAREVRDALTTAIGDNT